MGTRRQSAARRRGVAGNQIDNQLLRFCRHAWQQAATGVALPHDQPPERIAAVASSLASLGTKAVTQNRREWPRYQAERNFALAASVGGRLLPCTVVDVSLGGAKLAFDSEVPAGETIELSYGDGEPISCARVWQDSREVGIEFDFSEDSLGLISVCIRNIVDLERQPGR
mgnify:CR=1 FL=1